jgi:hypothetical protein
MDMPTVSCDVVCDAFVDELDGGSIMFHTSGDAEVAKCPLNTPAFGSAVNGVATMETGTPVVDSSTTAGTIQHAHCLDSVDAIRSKHTCGTGAEEFVFSTLEFTNNESLTVDSFTITWTPVAMT